MVVNCSFSFIVLLCLSQLCYDSFVCLYWFYLCICTFFSWIFSKFQWILLVLDWLQVNGVFFGLLSRILRFIVMGREGIVEHVVILAVCRSQETRTFHLPQYWLPFLDSYVVCGKYCCIKRMSLTFFYLQIRMALNCLKGFICQIWSFFSLPLVYIRKKNNSV